MFGLVVVLGLGVVAGCGRSASSGDARRVGSMDSSRPTVARHAGIDHWSQASEPPDGWTFAAPEVEAIRARPDRRGLRVEVRVEPVRLDDRSCAADAGGWIEETEPDIVRVYPRVALPNVLADASLGRWADEFGACPTTNPTIQLAVDRPLGDRDLMLDGVRWVPSTGDRYQRCELPACDPQTGAGAEVATCSDTVALVDDVRTRGDVPRHSDIGEVRCEGGWAMVEVDIGSSACPPSDGAANPCAGKTLDRLFLRAGTPHWEVIGRTRDAGCGAISDVAAQFPLDLCRDRPAL